MPEYLAPAVYVEEVSFRSKSIEGVSTTTTGFIGPTRFGPLDVEPELLTGLGDFERIYGDGSQLEYADSDTPEHNWMWHAVRAFFENGGKRLYVQRVFSPVPAESAGVWADAPFGGRAHGTPVDSLLEFESRFPGSCGSRRVNVRPNLGPNILSHETASDFPSPVTPGVPVLRTLKHLDIVWIGDRASDIVGGYYQAKATQAADGSTDWTFVPESGGALLTPHDLLVYPDDVEDSYVVRVVTATVTVYPTDGDPSLPLAWGRLPLDPAHQSFGAADSLFYQFSEFPQNLEWRRSVPIIIKLHNNVTKTGLEVLSAIFNAHGGIRTSLPDPTASPDKKSFDVLLADGNDGDRPKASAYEGDPRNPDDKNGLKAFEDLEDISIVAAPGATAGMEDGNRPRALTIMQLLIAHAERMKYRIAVLESGDKENLNQVSSLRAGLDSKHAALYYPWIRILDPITQEEISVPPAGFVAGIYARNDIQRAVYKAPANEVVTLALGFETTLNKGQQEVLNPIGVNCFRYFEGRGNRLWGARTISSDPEWKYVNLRRYFAYLERSIDVGTQWAVFEPNGPLLWANVRRTVMDFLFNEFVNGAFLGDKPETSYFVRCDRSTMTQNDIDNGRMVCLVGVAVVKPAEFVIFRIGQWTATASN